jgi:hypothetical protein
VKIDQYLDVAVRQETVNHVRVIDALEIDKHLDKLIERKGWKIGLM